MSSFEPVEITFYYDPACPWTWLIYRWLEVVLTQRPMTVHWRSLSLSELNKDKEIPDRFKPAMASSSRFLRVQEAMRSRAAGDPQAHKVLESQLQSLYLQSGILRFETEGHSEDGWIEESVKRAGLDIGVLTAADDPSWDAQVASSTNEAMDLAGPDVGSPVVRFNDDSHGFHGPVIDAVPGPEDSMKIWELLSASRSIPNFHEIKRGRKGAPLISKVPS